MSLLTNDDIFDVNLDTRLDYKKEKIFHFNEYKEQVKDLLVNFYEDILTLGDKVKFTQFAISKELQDAGRYEFFLIDLKDKLVERIRGFVSEYGGDLLREREYLLRRDADTSTGQTAVPKELNLEYIQNYIRQRVAEDLKEIYTLFYKSVSSPEDLNLTNIISKLLSLDRYFDTTNEFNILSRVSLNHVTILNFILSNKSKQDLVKNTSDLICLNLRSIYEGVLESHKREWSYHSVRTNRLIQNRDRMIDRLNEMFNSTPTSRSLNIDSVLRQKIMRDTHDIQKELLVDVQRSFNLHKKRMDGDDEYRVLDEKKNRIKEREHEIRANFSSLELSYSNDYNYDDIMHQDDKRMILDQLLVNSDSTVNNAKSKLDRMLQPEATTVFSDPKVSRTYQDIIRGRINADVLARAQEGTTAMRKFVDLERLIYGVMAILHQIRTIFDDIDDFRAQEEQYLAAIAREVLNNTVDSLTQKFYYKSNIFLLIDDIFRELKDCISRQRVIRPDLIRENDLNEKLKDEVDGAKRRKVKRQIDVGMTRMAKLTGLCINRLLPSRGSTKYSTYNVEQAIRKSLRYLLEHQTPGSQREVVPDKIVFYYLNDRMKYKLDFFKLYVMQFDNNDKIKLTEFYHVENDDFYRSEKYGHEDYGFDKIKFDRGQFNIDFDYAKVELDFENMIDNYNIPSKLVLSIYQMVYKEMVKGHVNGRHLNDRSPVLISRDNLFEFLSFLRGDYTIGVVDNQKDLENRMTFLREYDETVGGKAVAKTGLDPDIGNGTGKYGLYQEVLDNYNGEAAGGETKAYRQGKINPNQREDDLSELAKTIKNKVKPYSDKDPYNLKSALEKYDQAFDDKVDLDRIKERQTEILRIMDYERKKEEDERRKLEDNAYEIEELRDKLDRERIERIKEQERQRTKRQEMLRKEEEERKKERERRERQRLEDEARDRERAEKRRKEEEERRLRREKEDAERRKRLEEERKERELERERRRQKDEEDRRRKREDEDRQRKRREEEDQRRREREAEDRRRRDEEEKRQREKEERERREREDRERRRREDERRDREEKERREREESERREKKERDRRERELKEKREREEREKKEEEARRKRDQEERDRLRKEENDRREREEKEKREREERDRREREERERREREERERREREDKERREREEQDRREREERERKDRERRDRERKDREEKERREREEQERRDREAREKRDREERERREQEERDRKEKERKDRERREQEERERKDREKKEREEKERKDREKREREEQERRERERKEQEERERKEREKLENEKKDEEFGDLDDDFGMDDLGDGFDDGFEDDDDFGDLENAFSTSKAQIEEVGKPEAHTGVGNILGGAAEPKKESGFGDLDDDWGDDLDQLDDAYDDFKDGADKASEDSPIKTANAGTTGKKGSKKPSEDQFNLDMDGDWGDDDELGDLGDDFGGDFGDALGDIDDEFDDFIDPKKSSKEDEKKKTEENKSPKNDDIGGLGDDFGDVLGDEFDDNFDDIGDDFGDGFDDVGDFDDIENDEDELPDFGNVLGEVDKPKEEEKPKKQFKGGLRGLRDMAQQNKDDEGDMDDDFDLDDAFDEFDDIDDDQAEDDEPEAPKFSGGLRGLKKLSKNKSKNDDPGSKKRLVYRKDGPLIDEFIDSVMQLDKDSVEEYITMSQFTSEHCCYLLQEFLKADLCFNLEIDDILPIIQEFGEIEAAPKGQQKAKIEDFADRFGENLNAILQETLQTPTISNKITLLLPFGPGASQGSVKGLEPVLAMVNIVDKKVVLVSLSGKANKSFFNSDAKSKLFGELLFSVSAKAINPGAAIPTLPSGSIDCPTLSPAVVSYFKSLDMNPYLRCMIIYFMMYFESSADDYSLESITKNLEIRDVNENLKKRFVATFESLKSSVAMGDQGIQMLVDKSRMIMEEYNQTAEMQVLPLIEEQIGNPAEFLADIGENLAQIPDILKVKKRVIFGIQAAVDETKMVSFLIYCEQKGSGGEGNILLELTTNEESMNKMIFNKIDEFFKTNSLQYDHYTEQPRHFFLNENIDAFSAIFAEFILEKQ